jgi:hypothetical protein
VLQYLAKLHVQWPVYDNSQRAILIVFADIGSGMVKIGVIQSRHGNEEVVAQGLDYAHVYSIR